MRCVSLMSALLCIACASAGAAMFRTTVGSATLQLVLPAGMCQIDATLPEDAAYVAAIETGLAGTNKLLGAFADCNQLAQWRSSKKKFAEYGYYQTPIGTIDSVATADMVTDVCRELRSQGEKMLDEAQGDLTLRTQRALTGLQVSQVRSLGVIGEEANVCYSAVMRNVDEDGEPRLQDLVFALTVLKGKLLFLYVYAPHADEHAIPVLLDRVRMTVNGLGAANEN
jgi:hypothetical protein